MSWHLSQRLTAVHRAVSMALVYSVSYAALSSSAQAATIGKTIITSAQHEPLAASIMVTDIQAADFSASLANPIVYQQMGLTPTASMMVYFKPTSAISGQLFISTMQPVSAPFADMVLTINDGGQRSVIPKTLLMPLDDSLPIKPSHTIITSTQKPNLSVVPANNAKPLIVRSGTPPPLLSAPRLSATKLSVPNTQAPIQEPTQALTLPTAIVSAPHVNSFIHAPSNSSTSQFDSGTPAIRTITDKQLDILNIQVTRQIKPSNTLNTHVNSSVNPTQSLVSIVTNMGGDTAVKLDSAKPMVTTAPLSNVPPGDVAFSNDRSQQTSPYEMGGDASVNTAINNTSDSVVNYTVQRNDNLWIIAQQIAQRNNLDIQTVMVQIQSQNPNAFINQNADQLKTAAQLSLPNYEVVLSQQSLQAAISAQRQYSRQARTPVIKKIAQPKSVSKALSKATQDQRWSRMSNTLGDYTRNLE